MQAAVIMPKQEVRVHLVQARAGTTGTVCTQTAG